MTHEGAPPARFELRDSPSDRGKRTLDPMPICIVHAADDRVIFLNEKFPSAERHMPKHKPPAVTCIAEFGVKHHDDVSCRRLKCCLSDLVLQRRTDLM